jgi:RNA polymerase sigma factor (sigma-70 family)
MMETMTAPHVPPFERFYEEHRDVVLGVLRRKLGRAAAEDAFQETWLRALRAYGQLRHAENLRGWVLTIASHVAIDALRRPLWDGVEIEDLEATDERPTHAELDHLTSQLPPTERAAVVLRYGFDLTYEDIGDALGSSADAARQAASSGVRRLRRRMTE